MADVERTLLWKAISTGEFPEVVTRGLRADHFADDECMEVYEFCGDFMRLHKDPPSAKIVKQEFPDFKPVLSTDPLSYHMEQMVLTVKRRMSIDLVREYH